MTTKIQGEFLAPGIISDQTQVSAASADHVLIFDASDNSLKKALVSTITDSGTTAADDITAGDAAITISTSSGNITIDNGSSDDDIIFKGTDGGSDITALRLDMSSEGGATFNGNITLHDNKGVYFGAGSDLIISSNGTDATLDASGNLRLDADDAGEVRFLDGGTQYAAIKKDSNDAVVQSIVADGDLKFNGIDGSSLVTALTLDMSDAGTGIFNHDVRVGDNNFFICGAGDDVAIQSDGTNGTIFAGNGNLTLDVAGDITIDAGGEHIRFKDDGTERGNIDLGSANFTLRVTTSDNDMIFRGNDGGTDFTALTLDMSEAGAATFNSTVSFKFLNTAWINSADGINRLYYTANSTSFYKTADDHIFRNSSDANRFSIDNSGNGVFSGNVTAYGSPSDLKLKEDIEVIDNAVDKIKQLKGITYTLKSDGNRLTGLVAQDLEKVLPEAVYTEKDIETKDEHLAIRYGNTVGLLVEAIKELEARVKELESK